jgi:plastocyanin domain-containing protein
MTATQLVVTVLGIAAIGWELWYFVFSRRPRAERPRAPRVQEIAVTVKGGYTPDMIVVQAGQPVRLLFYRDETAECSERVVFESFGIDQVLPAFETTAVEFTPPAAGEYPFRCGMSMLKGRLIAEAPGADRRSAASPHRHHG